MDNQGFIKLVQENKYEEAMTMLDSKEAKYSTDRIKAIQSVQYRTEGNNNVTALMYAVKNNNIKMVKLLHEKTKPGSPLAECLTDHLSNLEIHHIGTMDGNTTTPLIYAIKQEGDDYNAMIELLLDLGTLTDWNGRPGSEDEQFMVFARDSGKLNIVTEALKSKLEKLEKKKEELEDHRLKDMSPRQKERYDMEFGDLNRNITNIEGHLKKSKELSEGNESEGNKSEGDESDDDEGTVQFSKGGQQTRKKRRTKRKHKRSKHKRSKHKQSKHKQSKNKRSKNKRGKNKRSNYTTRLRKNY